MSTTTLIALGVFLVMMTLISIFNVICGFHIRRYTDKKNISRIIYVGALILMSVAVILPFLFLVY